MRRLPAPRVLALLLCLAWPLWLFSQPGFGRPDNGDGYRVAGMLRMVDSTGQRAEPFRESADAYLFPDVASPPVPGAGPAPQLTPAASVARLVAQVSGWLGADGFGASTLASAYLAAPLAGVLLFFRSGLPAWGLALLAWALASPFVLSWLRSPFEEAATYALLPLWVAMAAAGWPTGSPRRHAAWLAVSFLLGASKVVWALSALVVLGSGWCAGRARRIAAIVCAIAVCASAVLHAGQYREANGFGRVFSGVCLTEAGVALWPERNLHDRELRLRSTAPPDCGPALTALGLDEYARWSGQGLWPEAAGRIPPAGLEEIRDRSSVASVARLFLTEPAIALRFVLNAWGVALMADYRVTHLPIAREPLPWPAMDPIVFLGGGVWLAGVASLLGLAVRVRSGREVPLAMAVLLLLAPLAVVGGNGFSDFEKHMAPFVHLAALCVVFVACRTAAVRRNGGG